MRHMLQSAQPEANGGKQGKAAREVALLEAKVRRLLELLGTVLEDTKANIEKKLARTYEELQAELNEADQVLSSCISEPDAYHSVLAIAAYAPGFDASACSFDMCRLAVSGICQHVCFLRGSSFTEGCAWQAPEEEDSDEDEYIYNPLKLPMGPDGKPIPYWLYKLHGLNQARCCCSAHHAAACPKRRMACFP